MITSEEAAERKKKIEEAAFFLFKNKGVDKVTYKDVAKLSGISEASIYHYYEKKSYLLLKTHERLWQELLKELESLTVDCQAFRELCGYDQLEGLIDAYEKVILTHREHLKFALECKIYWNRQSQIIDTDEYDSIVVPILQLFAQVFQKGVEDHSIGSLTEFETGYFLLWGVLRAYTEQMIMLDGFYNGENHFQKSFKELKKVIMIALRKNAGVTTKKDKGEKV